MQEPVLILQRGLNNVMNETAALNLARQFWTEVQAKVELEMVAQTVNGTKKRNLRAFLRVHFEYLILLVKRYYIDPQLSFMNNTVSISCDIRPTGGANWNGNVVNVHNIGVGVHNSNHAL